VASRRSIDDEIEEMIEFELPWPPSVNTYYRHLSRGPMAGRTLISAKGRTYRQDCIASLHEQNIGTGMYSGRLGLVIAAYPPDRRKRDLDNLLKATLDALVHTKIIRDDSDIDELGIARREVMPGGRLVLRLGNVSAMQ